MRTPSWRCSRVFPILLVVAAVFGQLSLVIGEKNAADVEASVLRFLQDLLTSSASPAISTAQQLFETSGDTLTLALVLALGSLAQAFARSSTPSRSSTT